MKKPNETCAILITHGVLGIEPECERALQRLAESGYTVRRKAGGAIDLVRSQMSFDAMRDGFEEVMWIDADVAFDPADVDRLRAHDLPIASGIYPKKGERALASNLLPGTKSLTFGEEGGLVRIAYAAAGFLLVQRRVFEALDQVLPRCNEAYGHPVVPYFMPTVGEDDQGRPWYLGEDFAFCARARRVGFDVWADTRIRLEHIGRYRYAWEDAGGALERFASYRYEVVS